MEMYFSRYIFQLQKHIISKDKICRDKRYKGSVFCSFLSVTYNYITFCLLQSLTDILSLLKMYIWEINAAKILLDF